MADTAEYQSPTSNETIKGNAKHLVAYHLDSTTTFLHCRAEPITGTPFTHDNVSINSSKLNDFHASNFDDPMSTLPNGKYHFKVFAGTDATGTLIAEANDVTVESDAKLTLSLGAPVLDSSANTATYTPTCHLAASVTVTRIVLYVCNPANSPPSPEIVFESNTKTRLPLVTMGSQDFTFDKITVESNPTHTPIWHILRATYSYDEDGTTNTETTSSAAEHKITNGMNGGTFVKFTFRMI